MLPEHYLLYFFSCQYRLMIFKGRVEEKYNYQPEVIISTIYFSAKYYTLPNS